MKPVTRPIYETLEDAIALTPRFHPSKSETQIAAEMGWTLKTLSAATDPNRKPRFAASWIVPLTLTTGNYAIVRTLCQLVGGVFVLLRRDESHQRHTAHTLKEISDYFGALAKNDSLRRTHREIDEIEHEFHEVIASGLSHIDKLRAEALER